jgi:hypothetical protein
MADESETPNPKKGQFILISHNMGDIDGLFLIAEDFDTVEEIAKFTQCSEYVDAPKGEERFRFVEYLIKNGLIAEVEYSELYLGFLNLVDAAFRPLSSDKFVYLFPHTEMVNAPNKLKKSKGDLL